MARPTRIMASRTPPPATSGQSRARPPGRAGGATAWSGEADIVAALDRRPAEGVRADRPARRLVDRGGPDRGVLLAHAPVRQEPRVLVAPELCVHQVLRARGQRPAADAPRGGLAHLLLQDLQAPPHERLRDAPPLRRI